MNPGTLGFYLPLFIPLQASTSHTRPALVRPNKTAILLGRPNTTLSASTRTSTSIFVQQESGSDWTEMDREFRKNLPDAWYAKRMIYRGGVMAVCGRLRVFDGLDVGEAERRKAAGLIAAARRA